MRTRSEYMLMGMLVVGMVLTQACASQSGSSGGDERRAPVERVDEPKIQHIPPPEYSLSTSQRPAMRAEVSARNPTGRSGASLLDVHFDFDRAYLRPDAFMVLETNAKRLQKNHVGRLLLEGRGDEIGTSEYNLVLGDRRARNVKRYLEDLGLSVEFTTISYGKDRPLCFRHDEDCMQRNRSVRFVVKE